MGESERRARMDKLRGMSEALKERGFAITKSRVMFLSGSNSPRLSRISSTTRGSRYKSSRTKFLAGKHRAFIGGKWVDAVSGKTFDTFDPGFAQVAECDAPDVDKAVAAAERAAHTVRVGARQVRPTRSRYRQPGCGADRSAIPCSSIPWSCLPDQAAGRAVPRFRCARRFQSTTATDGRAGDRRQPPSPHSCRSTIPTAAR